MSQQKVKIIWVGHEFNGPINGLAEYNSEQVWFSRKDSKDNDCEYDLIRISDDTLSGIQKNHEDYCNATGRPLYHGDPIKISRKSINDSNSENEDKMVTIYKHMYDNIDMSGEYITTIKSSNIINLIVPKRIIT